MFKFAMLTLTLAFAAASPAPAQTAIGTPTPPAMEKIFPNTPGVTRGLSSVNNSGQVGKVTLHKVSDDLTDVVLDVKGTVEGRPQLAGIIREPSGSCENPPKGPYDFDLQPVVNGHSHSQIKLAMDQLLSGNYFVIVYSNQKPAHYFSCGRLFNR